MVFRWKRIALYGVLGAIMALTVTVYLPWYGLEPGPARAVEPLIRFEDRARYESEGRFVMTSVRYTPLTAWDALFAWLDPDRAIVPRSELYPNGESPRDEHERSISQMDTSKLDASAVVLKELFGYPKQHGDGVLVESVVPGCAADGELFPGDRILAIDGVDIGTYRDAKRAIESATSGEALTFDLSVDGDPATARLVREPCGGRPVPLVGVSMINSFPFDVSISSGEVGGPSAGLMWALGLYDLLTPGDLTGGRTIAGTGALALDGTVIPIAGVAEKVGAAAHAGATVFLLPQDNADEARAAGGDGIELVPVETFDEAIAYLSGH